ncbi:hypothetical protein ACPV5J_05560 [Vibrio rotiferianus]|uniref:hypothetical protein n=1 Tax=Vibrio rotiferianus TaxID=190895 RepID=UPI00406A257E
MLQHSHFFIESDQMVDDLKAFFKVHKLPIFDEERLTKSLHYCRAAMSSFFWPSYDNQTNDMGKQAFLNLMTHGILRFAEDKGMTINYVERYIDMMLSFQVSSAALTKMVVRNKDGSMSDDVVLEGVIKETLPNLHKTEFGSRFVSLLTQRAVTVLSSKLSRTSKPNRYLPQHGSNNQYQVTKRFDSKSYKLRFEDKIISSFQRKYSESEIGSSLEVVSILFANDEKARMTVIYEFDAVGQISITITVLKSSALVNFDFRNGDDCVFIKIALN